MIKKIVAVNIDLITVITNFFPQLLELVSLCFRNNN